MVANAEAVLDALGEYKTALSHLERALRMTEALGDRAGVPGVLGGIGTGMYGLMCQQVAEFFAKGIQPGLGCDPAASDGGLLRRGRTKRPDRPQPVSTC